MWKITRAWMNVLAGREGNGVDGDCQGSLPVLPSHRLLMCPCHGKGGSRFAKEREGQAEPLLRGWVPPFLVGGLSAKTS